MPSVGHDPTCLSAVAFEATAYAISASWAMKGGVHERARTAASQGHILELYRLSYVHHRVVWSEWRGSNSRPPAPRAGALPAALHPVLLMKSALAVDLRRERLEQR